MPAEPTGHYGESARKPLGFSQGMNGLLGFRLPSGQREYSRMQTASVHKTFKYKLYPTQKQERTMAFVLRRCRELYNAALQERRDAWHKCGTSITCAHQSAQLPAIKAVRPEYHDVHSQVLQDVLTRLDRAFAAFFRRVQTGEKPGYPRFQRGHRYHSFTYKQFGNGATLDQGDLVLVKIGRIPVRWSRPMEGTIKTVTITHEADGWYVCFACEGVPIQPLAPTGQETGIDVGLKVFLVTAEGKVVDNPRYYRKAEKALAKAQRRVSRRKKGSNRRKKAAQWLAKKHQKVKRQRRDFHHKTALQLVRTYDVIYLEDLRVANLVQNSHLAKSISDAGWGQFRTILDGKAVYAGRRVIAVPPAYTSQDCSGCGERVEKSLSIRTHVCPSCGLVLDRDENAARNIQAAGQAVQGAATVVAVTN
jgi:putative transposase